MAKKLNHEEFERRVKEAMMPPGGRGFAPGIQGLRQSAKGKTPKLLTQGRG